MQTCMHLLLVAINLVSDTVNRDSLSTFRFQRHPVVLWQSPGLHREIFVLLLCRQAIMIENLLKIYNDPMIKMHSHMYMRHLNYLTWWELQNWIFHVSQWRQQTLLTNVFLLQDSFDFPSMFGRTYMKMENKEKNEICWLRWLIWALPVFGKPPKFSYFFISRQLFQLLFEF